MLKARPADTAPETASLRVRAVLRWEGGPRDNTHSETPGRSTTFTSPPLIRGVQGDGEQLHVGSLHSWCRGWKSVKRSHSDHKAGQTHACVPRRRHGAHWMRMRTSRGPPPTPPPREGSEASGRLGKPRGGVEAGEGSSKTRRPRPWPSRHTALTGRRPKNGAGRARRWLVRAPPTAGLQRHEQPRSSREVHLCPMSLKCKINREQSPLCRT